MRRPSFQFYPSDWRKDPALASCPLAARGLWIELMCVMHESDDYGHLSVNGRPFTINELARIVGESPTILKNLLKNLEDSGVFSRDERGVIYSRRMVRDEHLRNVRSAAGKLGGNPGLLKQKVKQEVKSEPKQELKQTSKQNPTPSSSSSSSSSIQTPSVPNGTGSLAQIPPSPKPKVKAEAIEKPCGVADGVWVDFLALRKAKRAPLTQTALDGIEGEAKKAGVSLQTALETCCARGWQGFRADWYAQNATERNRTQSFAQQDREAGMLRWEQMTGRQHPDRLRPTGTVIEIQAAEVRHAIV